MTVPADSLLNPATTHLTPTLILAPIRGVTDVVYREAFADCFGGFDGAVAPFLQLRQGHPLRPAELRQVALENNQALLTIPQVLTHHPQTFSLALRELSSVGHAEVNWNLGCPYPTVAGRGRGAGLLPQASRIDAILTEVMKDIPLRLSVKMRLGYHDPDEYQAVLEVLNRFPLTQVMLHARTADQMYEGQVDIDRAGSALNVCRHAFVYNGDIASIEGFRELQQKLPSVTTWMIGRGALRNPFLPAQIKGGLPLSTEARRGQLVKFHARLYEGYGEWLSGDQHRMDKMLEQWEYLACAFAESQLVYSRLRRSTARTYLASVEWAFSQAFS